MKNHDWQTCERALEISRSIGDRVSEGALLSFLGVIIYASDRYGLSYSNASKDHNIDDESIKTLEKALSVHHEIGNQYSICIDLVNLGLAYASIPIGNKQKNLLSAIKSYEEALEIAMAIGDKVIIGTVYGNLGNIYANEMKTNPFKNIEKGIVYYQQALEIFINNHDEENEIFWLIKLGKAYANLLTGDRNSNLDHAIKFLVTARDKLFKIGEEVDEEDAQLKIIWENMRGDKSQVNPVKYDLLRSLSHTYSELGNNKYSEIYEFLIPKDIVGAADGGASLREYFSSERYYWMSRMQAKPVLLTDMSAIVKNIQSYINKSLHFQLSVSCPKLFSKRYDSIILIQLYLPENRKEIIEKLKKLSSEMGEKDYAELIYDTGINPDVIVTVNLFSPDIEFSEQVTKLLKRGINQFHFIAKPREACNIDKPHTIKLSIYDKSAETELESIVFKIKVADFAFDHISRPLLSRVSTVFLGIGSLVMFVLTLLEQIDKTVGLTSGTAAGVLAVAVYAVFYNLYQRVRPSTP